jgi:hypothetical protein
LGKQHQAAGGFGATHGGVRDLDQTDAGGVFRAKQVVGDFRVIHDEGEFVVKVLAGGHGEAAEAVKLAGERLKAPGCGGSLFLHT